MGYILSIKKRGVYLLCLLTLSLSCNHEEAVDMSGFGIEDSEIDGDFVLRGSVYVSKLHSELAVFRVQLIKGDVTNEMPTENFVYPEARILAVKSSQSFEFGRLSEGVYTIVVSREGFKEVREKILIGGRTKVNRKDIIMYPIETDRNYLCFLDEEGQELKSIEIIPYVTLSISFYLYNRTESHMSYNLNYYMTEGYNMRSFIINGKIECIYTTWIEDINQKSGELPPNTLHPIEVQIDPSVYLVNAHSKCKILVNNHTGLELSF